MRRLVLTLVLIASATLGACGGSSGTRGAGRDAPSTTARTDTTTTVPYRSEVYADPARWLCRPDRTDDVCDRNLDATVVAADGSTSIERFVPATEPALDCFYVYPTFSDDPTPNSDLVPNDSEGWPTLNQAARFGQVCRVFAPVYRQITMSALFGGASPSPESREIAYADVLDAWRHYLANDNDGRGVVLIGHSQGASHLRRLIAEEIDPSASRRARLVSAILLGAAVRVPGASTEVGGDFQHVPVCAAPTETGCVISYATFSSTSPPPPSSRFGKPRDGDGMAVCTNPASLGGGRGKLTSYFTTETVQGRVDAATPITTPFVKFAAWADAECAEAKGFRWLQVTFPTDSGAWPGQFANAPDATWGLHLIDANVAMGNLIELVRSQAAAYDR